MRKTTVISILSLLFWMGLPVVSHALTASQIISEARVYLKDQSTAGDRRQFSDATLLSFVNDGQREANAVGWLMQSSFSFTLTGGVTEYAMPSDFMATQFTLFKDIKIDQTSMNELNANSLGWRTTKGTPNKYYIYLGSPTVMGFVPAPTTTSTGTVTVYYIQQPAELTSTAQEPFNGWSILRPYHSGLVYYVTYRCYQVLEEETQKTQYFNEWLSYLQYLSKGIMKQPDFNPGFQGSAVTRDTSNSR